jgi:hypothetical protein
MKKIIALLAVCFSLTAFGQGPTISLPGPAGVTGSQSLLGQYVVQSSDCDTNGCTLTPQEWWAGTIVIPSSISFSTSFFLNLPPNVGQKYTVFNYSSGGQTVLARWSSSEPGNEVNIIHGDWAPIVWDSNFNRYRYDGIVPNAGVSSINGNEGDFTFTGSGVSCDSTTCTFSGGSSIPDPSALQNPVGEVPQWNGSSYQPASPRIVSAANIQIFGDSISCGKGSLNYTGDRQTNLGWAYIFENLVNSNTFTNNCQSGTTITDITAGQIFKGGAFGAASANLAPYASQLSILEAGTYNAGYPDYLPNPPANILTAYSQVYWAALIGLSTPSLNLITPSSNGVTLSGSHAVDSYFTAFPGVTLTSTGATATFSITTTGQPIYLVTSQYGSDTGSFTVSIDGTLATDTITGSSTIANTPYGGTPFVQDFAYTQVPAASRFPVAAGTHTVVLTCTAVGTNGCSLLFATTPASFPSEYIAPTEVAWGVLPFAANANGASTAAYNTQNQTAANQANLDGLPVIFNNVRQIFTTASIAYYMSSTDGATSAGTTLTDISTTSGSSTITSASYNFTEQDLGKQLYVEAAGNEGYTGTSLYCIVAAVSGHTATCNTIPNPGALGVPNSATATIASGGTAYLGWLGQVYTANDTGTQSPQPNYAGHDALARQLLQLLQPVTTPGEISYNLPPGVAFNINKNNTADATVTSGPTTNAYLTDYGNLAIGQAVFGTGFFADGGGVFSQDVFGYGPVRLCPNAYPNNMEAYNAECSNIVFTNTGIYFGYQTTMPNINATGGVINNTSIGNVTPAAGTFTTVTANSATLAGSSSVPAVTLGPTGGYTGTELLLGVNNPSASLTNMLTVTGGGSPNTTFTGLAYLNIYAGAGYGMNLNGGLQIDGAANGAFSAMLSVAQSMSAKTISTTVTATLGASCASGGVTADSYSLATNGQILFCNGTIWTAPTPASNSITSATGGSGTSTVSCLTAACTNLRGTYSVAGGTFTTGAFLTLVWPVTATAYACSVTQDGGAAWLGLGHSVATTTGMNITSDVSISGTTVTFDYVCQP